LPDWVWSECGKEAEDCRDSQCCRESGKQCYKQSDFWAQCKDSCIAGEKFSQWEEAWSCDLLGPRTQSVVDPDLDKGLVGEWVEKTCNGAYEDCSKSGCCYGVDAQCYSKDKFYAECKTTCDPTEKDSDGDTWECIAKGPRGWGLATKGYPSLYCISLFMPTSYEGGLLSSHLDLTAGIFACDGWDIFAAHEATLGWHQKDNLEVKAVLIPDIAVGKSQDGTAGNAKLFMALWDKIIEGGRFRYYDWTIKVDPDAVVIPERMRNQLRPHVGEKIYVVNCNKYPSSPNFPMMYGAVEVFSQPAMEEYAVHSWKCGKDLPWSEWGEDYYMTHCLDYIDVGRISDFTFLADGVCLGAHCEDPTYASYHPFKTVETWKACYDLAVR